MICRDCGNGRHESCPGGTWCPCQHRTDRRPTPADIAARQSADATIGALYEHVRENGLAVVYVSPIPAWHEGSTE